MASLLPGEFILPRTTEIRTTVLRSPDLGEPFNMAVGFERLSQIEIIAFVNFARTLEAARVRDEPEPARGNRFDNLDLEQ